jgi:protein-export SecD/SecF family membrane protein
MILAWTGLTVPVPGQNEFVEIYGARDIRFGVDIVGGVEAVFAARDFEGTPSADELASARNVLELRMDNLQILDREITVERSKGRIIVRFPWKSGETTFNPDEALTELGEMARLTFRDPDGNVIMDGTEISKSMAAYDPNTNDPIVSLEMTSEGADKFGEATARLIGQPIYIFMDEVQISAPTVNSAIYNGKAVIENIGTAEEAIDLAEKINAGALPFALEAISSSTISPTMGRGALNVMMQAGLIAFLAICLFMLLYYRLPGFVACIALLGQVVGILLAISIPQQTLTLQGIAGIILSIGMGVDANVIIAERIKEELNSGCSLPTALSNGFTRAFSAVLDGNVTVAIAAVILMIFGSGSMLSFGYSLLTGVILNALTGVTASRLMIGALSSMKPFKATWLYGKRRVKASV